MAQVYVQDELIYKIMACKKDKQTFIKEAIIEKLQKECPDNED